MTLNFLYCIDYPGEKNKKENIERVFGWILCSRPIISIKILNKHSNDLTLKFNIPRPDVAKVFKDFSENENCGFEITAGKTLLSLKEILKLEVKIQIAKDISKKISVAIDLNLNTIQDFEVYSNKLVTDWKWKRTEKKYFNTLKKRPWITIRTDITNKCNLRCIMCHCKEKEIYSRPAKYVTAEELKQQLQDIAPYVKHIMLSCGYEPLLSKHFTDIVKMIRENFSHMEIGLVTNGMLLDSKARKAIIENQVTNVLLSLDGVTKNTVEKIRVGCDFQKVVGNIMALRDLRKKFNRTFPLMYMDFVLMNSNVHEAPAFVEFCKELGMNLIDFRHMVGNVYFSEHEEMLSNHKEKFNYYRKLILAESKKFNINIRIPDAYNVSGEYFPENVPDVDLSDVKSIIPDNQIIDVNEVSEVYYHNGDDSDFGFLSGAKCLRPFNEIMIREQSKIWPCSYYGELMGELNGQNSLHSIFLSDKFSKVRKKKLNSDFDFNCTNCPIKSNLLPTEIIS